MSTGPPYQSEKTDHRFDWRDLSTSIEGYPDRDIRLLMHEQRAGTLQNPKSSPAEFGDFDPQPDDPDPDVWPLEGYDTGYPAPVEDLICVTGSFPAPHVRWVTEEYLEARYGYNPVKQELRVEEVPEWARPDRKKPGDTVEIDARNESPNRMELTEDRVEALTRVAKLWNGKVVRGHHLLLDKCPNWTDLFADLDGDELKRFVVDPSVDLALLEEFGDHDWWTTEKNVYMAPQRILRKKVWYSPTQRGKILINRNDLFPTLKGDPRERLEHRVTVGLAALREKLRGHDVTTYHEVDGHVVDIVSKDDTGQWYVGEAVTGHNNWRLHRETYRKLRALESKGALPYLAFAGRGTAYKVMNHWHRQGLAELPTGPFNSHPRTEWGREKIQEAYRDETINWCIEDWITTDVLWTSTLGSDGPDVSSRTVTSLNW